MKNTKLCPKCGSCDIIVVSMRKTVSTIIPIGFTMAGCVGLSRYVCGECGYTEEWIVNRDDIERIRSKFSNKQNQKN